MGSCVVETFVEVTTSIDSRVTDTSGEAAGTWTGSRAVAEEWGPRLHQNIILFGFSAAGCQSSQKKGKLPQMTCLPPGFRTKGAV